MTNLKLDLGCGDNKVPCTIGVDIEKLPGVDIICNLERFPWPFKDSSFEAIYCSHLLEHFSDTVEIMEEIYRIAKNGAIVNIIVPHVSYEGAFRDPTHKSFFTYRTFEYFAIRGDNLPTYYSKAEFKIEKIKLIFMKRYQPLSFIIEIIANKLPTLYENAWMWIFPANTLNVVLKVTKSGER